jgi:hypothetical protein
MNILNSLILENETIRAIPKNVKHTKSGICRMECVVQTVGDVNRNKRRYSKQLIDEGLKTIDDRVKERSFLGELDHPIDRNPTRQITVLYHEASHLFIDFNWDGNKLIATMECLSKTPNGQILQGLAEQKVAIGFSFRGMGDLRQISEGGEVINEVVGPLHIVSWDAVSYPSHKDAKIIKITESVQKSLFESVSCLMNQSRVVHEEYGITESKGLICTKEGICYLPNEFDKLVDQRVITLVKKFI